VDMPNELLPPTHPNGPRKMAPVRVPEGSEPEVEDHGPHCPARYGTGDHVAAWCLPVARVDGSRPDGFPSKKWAAMTRAQRRTWMKGKKR
jgi:hypothetical protein